MAKRKKLADYVTEAQAVHGDKCDGKNHCPLMAAVLAVHGENLRRPAFEVAPMFNLQSGKPTREQLVYFVRQGEYALVNFCPFCGASVNTKPEREKRSKGKAA